MKVSATCERRGVARRNRDNSQPFSDVPALTKFLQDMATFAQLHMLRNVAGQVSTLIRARPGAAALTIWSQRDAVCWPGRQPKETAGESSCRLCCGDERRGGPHRLVGRVPPAAD